MTLYNHMFFIGFSLENESADGVATGEEIRTAILKRLDQCSDDELIEACGCPDDTYRVDGDPYMVKMSVTRVSEYETQIRAESLEAAHRIASELAPEDCEEISQNTIYMGVEVDPV